MKKKRCTIIAVIILLAAALLAVWYFLPMTFLKGVASSDVTLISVFDGNTGESFEICDADEIRCIVENIQNTKMKKDKLSLNYTGYSFRMKFCSEKGKELASFILNSESTIRKDPFFYRCDGGLCYDYLKELEEKS